MNKPVAEMTQQEITDYLAIFDLVGMISNEDAKKLLEIARRLNKWPEPQVVYIDSSEQTP